MPFKKGNQEAKKKGPHLKTKQWEALHESIIGEHADNFNALMNELWTDEDIKNRIQAGEFYL